MSERRISEQAAFYLEHENRIREWSGLVSEVQREAHDFFCSLADPLDALRPGLSGGPELYAQLERAEPPKLFLHKEEWRPAGLPPRIGIGVEWPKTADFNNAYIGVWTDNRDWNPDAVASSCSALAEAAIASFPGSGPSSNATGYRTNAKPCWFPVIRSVRPTQAHFWENLDALAEQIVGEVASLWEALYEAADMAFTEAGR